MNPHKEICVSSNFEEQWFWYSVNILINKPHVVNKRLWGCKIIQNIKCNLTAGARKALQSLKLDVNYNYDRYMKSLLALIQTEEESSPQYELILVELLPKNYEKHRTYQLVVLDFNSISVTFYDITSVQATQNICPNFTYSFQYYSNKIKLIINDNTSKSVSWLKDVVLPQVVKWAEENDNNLPKPFCKESLNLITSDEYYMKYNELKIKYGKELVKIWPESTDPLKFVYEDIAIASYLILLWGDQEKHTFVDIGCGNGLLVYILTMEGHNGIGVDVRKRKIWDMYPKNVKLEEYTIKPSNIDNFSTYEWIIGNHSDELTPWIPVIAAQSSYNAKFFLLPCCAYNMDGTKYSRQDSSKSQYTEYLEFIKNLCEDFGFIVKIDRLKIPSTKRICLVGKKRSYPPEKYEKYVEFLKESVDLALRSNEDIKTREKVEKVRNCTQINKNIIDTIVQCVSSKLLEGCDFSSTWSSGKEVKISELINIIPEHMLKNLKAECGGLQTLLRNNHHIFQVVNGYVQFRYPKTIQEVHKSMKDRKKDLSSIKMQVKRCWFYDNHPQGCPLSNETCSYLHVQS